MKLSQWHDGKVKPVHVGVYERKDSENVIVFCKWDGLHWFFMCFTAYEAEKENRLSFSQLCKPWRGIVKDKK